MEHARILRSFSIAATATLVAASFPSLTLAAEHHGGGGHMMKPGEHMTPGSGHMKSGGHKMSGDRMKPGGHKMSGEHGGGHGNAAGEPGKASEASRTINIVMTDNRYSIDEITVTAGETIRFVVVNKGELVHEFNIGTPDMHKGHRKEMMMMVDHGVLEADRINHARMKMDMGGGKTMEHNDPNSALLEPGKSKKIVWKFSKAGTFEFACNVPGHYDAGMVGEVQVK
jgi:uncharacterized cupredoxin-like copper-binding protein